MCCVFSAARTGDVERDGTLPGRAAYGAGATSRGGSFSAGWLAGWLVNLFIGCIEAKCCK